MHLALSPARQRELQQHLMERAQDTWAFALQALSGAPLSPDEGFEGKADRRFAAPDWSQFPFNVYARAYHNAAALMKDAVRDVDGVTEYHDQLLEFALRMLLDASSPSNFLASNPEVLALTQAEKGQNLVRGFKHLVEDMRRTLAGSEPVGTDEFEVGRHVAVTPGKVVFRNELIENHLSIEQRESENFEHEWENDLSRVAVDEDARIIAADLLSFFHERLKVFLRDTGARHDLIDAVVTPLSDDLLLVVTKVRALQALVESPDGANLLSGYKRAANILAAEEKKGTGIAASVDPALFGSDAEKALYAALAQAEEAAASAVSAENFEAAMAALASLRAPIDAFFDTVMVNVEDAGVRANRLGLLARIRSAIHTVADFSRIAG